MYVVLSKYSNLSDDNSEQSHIIQLPPIHNYCEHGSPSSSPMSRKSSIVSASSGSGAYQGSRSTSPNIAFLEPSYDHSPAVNRVNMYNAQLRDYAELIPNSHSQGITAIKAPRRKRNDRMNFSKHAKDGVKSGRISKDEGEAGRRFDHGFLMARLQNAMLAIYPNLPQEAKQGGGHDKPGWTLLKVNNRSNDVRELGMEPLAYNKANIYDSAYQIIEDSNCLLDHVVRHREAEEIQAKALLQSGGPMSEEIRAYLSTIAYGNIASRIQKANKLRGCQNFSCSP
jgi:hypothetical protein